MNTAILPTRSTSAVRTPEVAVGALIIALCVVGAMAWGRSAVSGTSVLVVNNDVRKGAVLDADDLSTITLTSSDDIALVRASSLNDAVGRRAAVDITAGTPLTPSQLTSASIVSSGEGLVGLTIDAGEAPATLAPGDSVRVLTVTRGNDGTTTSAVEPTAFEVWDISEPDPLDATRVVTLKIDIDLATTLLGREEIRLMKVNG